MPIIRLSAHERGGIIFPTELLSPSHVIQAAGTMVLSGIMPEILRAGSNADLTIAEVAARKPYRMTAEVPTDEVVIVSAQDEFRGVFFQLTMPEEDNVLWNGVPAGPGTSDTRVYDIIIADDVQVLPVFTGARAGLNWPNA